MKKIFKNTVLVLIGLFVLACEREDLSEKYDDETFIISNQYSKDNFSKIIPYSFKVDWKKYRRGKSNLIKGDYFYEFDVVRTDGFDENKPKLDKPKNVSFISYRFLVVKVEEDFEFFLLKLYDRKLSDNNQPITDEILSSKSCRVFDSSGARSNLFDHYLLKSNSTGRWPSRGFPFDNDCVEEYEIEYIDWYDDRGDYYEFNRRQFLGIYKINSCDDEGIVRGDPLMEEHLEELRKQGEEADAELGHYYFMDEDVYYDGVDKIVDSIQNKIKNPCGKKIVEDMRRSMEFKNFLKEKNLEGGTHNFSEMILDLFDKSQKTDLIFKEDNLSSLSTNGRTVGTTITLDENYLKKATTLSVARTIIHESIHAYLNVSYRYQEGFKDKSFYNLLHTYYEKNKNKLNGDAGRFHHEFMGQYIDAMAISLQEWDKKYGTGGNLGWEYYRAMAFGGLVYKEKDKNGKDVKDANGDFIYKDTDSFKSLVPKGSDRNKIKKLIENEKNGNSYAKGNKC